jgi:hypothetical protein
MKKRATSFVKSMSLLALLLWLLSGVCSLAQDARSTADFFVALNGNDAWSGHSPQPNASRTDGPFATLARARDAVREFKQATKKKDIVVSIRGGVYRLTETLVFSLKDSAPEGGTITYAAYGKEVPILTSGARIQNWRKLKEPPAGLPAAARGKVWVADVPRDLDRFLTLYEAEERLPRARGEGFGPPQYVDKKTSPPEQFSFPAGAMRNWPDLKDAEVAVIPTANYEMCILPLASVDEEHHTATLAYPPSRPIGKAQFIPISAWVENILEVLDQPGEWVINTAERKVYLWPKTGKPSPEIVAPRLTELLRIEGAIDYDGPKDTPVRGLIFRGLTFNHAERFQWHGYTGWGLQHHWEMFDRPTAALRLRGAENCVVQACRFAATSGTAIRLDLHCQQNRIVDNEIAHIGGVGVLLAGYGPGTKNVNRKNEVVNNWIHHTGELYWATPGVMVWQSGENRIAHNLIHNTPYSGITVSTRSGLHPGAKLHDGARSIRSSEIGDPDKFPEWADQEPFLHARKNIVELNDIHHVMEVLCDGDGIYISGTGRENHIRQNYIHDCDSDRMADGIRCDDAQDETIIEGNLIYRIRRVGQGICSKGKNHILNNVLVDLLPSRLPIRPDRVVRGYIGLEVNPVTGSRVEHNLCVSRVAECPPMIQNRRYGAGGEPRLRECKADDNLYYCFADAGWGRKHLETEQPFGVETHSLAADPLFVDFEKGDFRLKPESPALKLGFQPVDWSAIGLLPNHPYKRKDAYNFQPLR